MSLHPGTDAAGAIRYALTSRLSPEGRVAISLLLYRGGGVAHSRSLGVVERHQLVDVMYKCRLHRLSAPEPGRDRLPPAQTLTIRR